MAEKELEREKSSASGSTGGLVVSDQEQDLAQAALSDFTKGNYSACLGNLTKLESTWTHDTKVAHNKAVAEYYKSDLKKTDQFRKSLNNLRSQAIFNGDEVVGLDDVEQCVLYYNHAVILFHLKQYNAALRIIEEVYSFIEPMEESLAHKVCLLLIELHLCTRRVDKALEYVTYITTQFASTKNIQVLEKEPPEKPVAFDAATDAFRLRLLQFQARAYLMNNCLKGSKREMKGMAAAGGGNNLPSVFLKANLEYLKRNYPKAIKALNSVSEHQVPPFRECGEPVSMLYLNNMACIHHAMGKPHLACYYLQRAIREHEETVRSGEGGADPLASRPLYTLGASRNAELMYNLGVALLYAGKPCPAFDCLTEAVQVFHMNPRLWLRMAECCIVAHKAGNEEDFNLHVRKSDLVASVAGAGPHRKLVLSSRLSRQPCYQSEGQSFAIPSPGLEFASLCLKNVLLLVPPGAEGECVDGRISPPLPPSQPAQKPQANGTFYGAPSSPMTATEVAALRCSALAAAAYVALSLGDHVLAVEHARELLSQPRLTGAHRLLGHLYAAEGLVMTDRIAEALDHLNPELVTDVAISFPQPIGDDPEEEVARPLKEWYPNNVPTAKALMQYHLAVALAIRGDLDKSGDTLQQVWMRQDTCDIPIQVVMLALYIQLQLGHADNCRAIIKQHCPHIR